jgi:hypothetical protein
MAAKTLALNMVMNTDQFRRDVKVAQDAIRDLSTQTEKAKQIAGNFKLAGFDTSQLSNIKSQFETTGKLQDRFYAATHTNLEVALKNHDDYFANLRVKWQGNESMLTKINKTGSAERLRILDDYVQKKNSTLGGIYGLYSKYLTIAFVAYGVQRALKSVANAAMEEQSAESNLQAVIGGNITAYRKYAEQLSNQTVYGDERIMQEMAYGKNLGITEDKLNAATKAAIGLSARYKIDLSAAMKIVGKASQGYFDQLARVGIILDSNSNSQVKLNEIMRLGTEGFRLAEAQTNTAAGAFKQWENASHSLKASLGESLLPALTSVTKEATKAAQAMSGKEKPPWWIGLSPLTTGITGYNLYKKGKKSTEVNTEGSAAPVIPTWKPTEYTEDLVKRVKAEAKMYEQMGDYGEGWIATQKILLIKERDDYIEAGVEKIDIKKWQDSQLQQIQDEAAAKQKGNTKAVLDSTRDALEQMRTMDYLTRTERIMNLEAYKAAHADVMTDVVGKETESAKLINKEIENLQHSRLDAMKEYATELKNDMQDSALYTSEKFAAAAQSIEGSMSSAFQSMITKGASLKEAMSAFLTDIANSFAKMASDMASRSIMNISMKILGIEAESAAASIAMGTAITTSGSTAAAAMGTAITTSGSLVAAQMAAAISTGQFIGPISGALGGSVAPELAAGPHVMHAGGIVGSNYFPKSQVPASLFASAPRLHSGLRSDEYPAILQKGERVTSRSDVQKERSGGNTPNVKVIIVSDQKQASIEAMQSEAGEKVIIKSVLRNRRVLG